MAVIAVAPALEFKFDMNALPTFGSDLSLGLAIGESALNRFDQVAQFPGNHAEEEDDALFVDRLVTQPAEVEGFSVNGAILKGCMLRFVGNWGRVSIRRIARRLRRGGRQKSQNVSPLRLASGKVAKNFRQG